MSQQAFPEQIDVRRFFSQEAAYKADVPLHLFPRLTEYLSQDGAAEDAQVAVDLQFRKDQQGRHLITGTLEGELLLDCQRCLQSMPYRLRTELNVQVLDRLVESGDRELDENEMDVVLSREGKLDLLALIEDELILSLPIVLYHETRDCNQALNELKDSEGEGSGRDNPFAQLESLKQQLHRDKRGKSARGAKSTKSAKSARKHGRKN